jgi:hypothetical protein
VKVAYALFPQAKGKIERPYRWIQDRLVRTCYRENIRDIKKAQLILNYLIRKYNYHLVHSTTGAEDISLDLYPVLVLGRHY